MKKFMKSASTLQGFFETNSMELSLEWSHNDISCFCQVTYKSKDFIAVSFKNHSLSFFDFDSDSDSHFESKADVNPYSNSLSEAAYTLKLAGDKGYITKIKATDNRLILLLTTSKGFLFKLNLSSTPLNSLAQECDPLLQLYPCILENQKKQFFLP